MLRKINRYYREKQFPLSRGPLGRRAIFIHVPKVAGSSVLQALGQKTEQGRLHLPWYVYYEANPRHFEKVFKFAFVRNPWTRTLSAYQYLLNGGNQRSDLTVQTELKKYKSYDHFLCEGLAQGYFRNHLMFIPQSEFLLGPNEELMVDELGMFETLEEDFAKIAQKLNINGELPKKNRTDYVSKSKKNAYSSVEAQDVIRNVYAQDLRVFSYNLDVFDTM